MIVDQAIFSMARTGTIDDRFDYPAILSTVSGSDLERGEGYLKIADRRIEMPDLLQAVNSRGWYLDSEKDIAVIPDAVVLIQRPQKLLARIFELREKEGYRPLIYAPGIGDPYLIPALVYAGISIFDDLFIRAESSDNVLYATLGRTSGKGDLLNENILFAHKIMDSVSRSIGNLTLRELVEKYSISSRAVELMRILDTSYYDSVEPLYPYRTPYIKANSVESLLRPDLARYRSAVSGLFRKPEEKKVAFILPCTAKKPYSASKTHRKIFSRIERYSSMLHKLVVTSPVGIVPEELEETYPPGFYDIPTIGLWFEDEKLMINNMLKKYFSGNSYEEIVAYITPDLSFIRDALPEGANVLEGEIKSEQMLGELRELISEIYGRTDKHRKVNHKFRKLKAIASFQFGSWIEQYIDDMKLVRSYNQDMLMKDGRAMLVYNERAGKITITKEMGRTFIEEKRFVVEIDDFKPTANVYAMGVKDATSDIRQENEVVLSFDGEPRGVGIAKMPGAFMRDLKKGIAVKVRN